MQVLLIVDVQKAVDAPGWRVHGERNNPDAEVKIALLLAAWRERGWPVCHVRHDSSELDSPYRPGQPGNDFKSVCAPLAGEPVIAKRVDSAFIGTELEALLRSAGHTALAVCGVITNNSVEATVRMAGNLGFDTVLIEDACFTFARPDWNGTLRSAEEVHAMSVANLAGEYCRVAVTADLIR